MPIDPVTLEILRNKFEVIADEMQSTLIMSSYSSVVKEGKDASAALFSAQGETIAQAREALPAHLGMLEPAIHSILNRFPTESMRPGDVFIMNDPYDGGTHLPDITLVVPVVHEGDIVALSCTMTHHQDVGGKTPGSIPTDATEIYQEGLIIPPLKLYDQGTPNQTLIAMIRKNVRIPDIVMGDLDAQLAAGNVGRNRLLEVFNQYGRRIVSGAVYELFDHAEKMTRSCIEEIPDGTYSFTDYLDNDGVALDKRVKVQVTITIAGSDFHVDFTGSHPQTAGPINCVPSPTLSSIYYVVRAITDPAIPNNYGCYRPVHVHLPEGTIVNCRPPAAVNARRVVMTRIIESMFGALFPAIPHKVIAASAGLTVHIAFGGLDPKTGRRFVLGELIAGGQGARPNGDGLEFITSDISNSRNMPVEALELDFPFLIHGYNLREDGAGAGRFRGGLGIEKVFELLRGEVTVSYRGERHFLRPWGLDGGLPAKPWQAVVIRKSGHREEIHSKAVMQLGAGDRLMIRTAGGGGFGRPWERDPALVLADIRDGKISQASAREQYGVISKADGDLDETATARARREISASGVTGLPLTDVSVQ